MAFLTMGRHATDHGFWRDRGEALEVRFKHWAAAS